MVSTGLQLFGVTSFLLASRQLREPGPQINRNG